jgi:hypothetical protein
VNFIEALLQAFYVDKQETILGMPMDRTEAVTFLKELLSQCDMSPASVSFENPKDSDSIGYRVHIRGAIQESDKEAVRDVAKRHSLNVQEDNDGVIVYKSRLNAEL